jgi:hypothetical protein
MVSLLPHRYRGGDAERRDPRLITAHAAHCAQQQHRGFFPRVRKVVNAIAELDAVARREAVHPRTSPPLPRSPIICDLTGRSNLPNRKLSARGSRHPPHLPIPPGIGMDAALEAQYVMTRVARDRGWVPWSEKSILSQRHES